MVVLAVWIIAVVLVLILVAVLAFELIGHVRRLRRAAAAAGADLTELVRTLGGGRGRPSRDDGPLPVAGNAGD